MTSGAQQSAYDVDVAVVGSGFGGSVAALRLAEKGYSVTVFESGRRFEDEEFARTSWDVRRYFWAPRLGCYGVQRIHKLPDVVLLAGAGVGGGSLNYANTLYVPPKAFFDDPQWRTITDWAGELAPHYDQAARMLGVVENPCEGPVEEIMRAVADDMGVGHTFRKTPVGVFFGRPDGATGGQSREPGRVVPDPFFGGAGPSRTGCTECGNCMVGCRVGAKNTLVKNYLALAEGLGVRVEPLRTVVDVRPLDARRRDQGYAVTTERTGAWFARDRRTVTAAEVVLAAGTWGTQKLLHSLRASGSLPDLSERLGQLTRTNSEALLGAVTRHVPPDADLARGVAITSSFHPDADTHVENVRYGKGSNAMGLLGTLLVDGGGRTPRWAAVVGSGGPAPRPGGSRGLGTPLERAHGHRSGHAEPGQLADRLRPPAADGPRHQAHIPAGPRQAQPDLDPLGAQGNPGHRRTTSGPHQRARGAGRHDRRRRGHPDDRAFPGRLRHRRDLRSGE